MKINVMTDVLEANDRIAAENRQLFDSHKNLVLNLMSSPGAGKTILLEKTAQALKGKLRLGVIVGDIETARDKERLEKYDLPVVQLNTGSACHLDANMIASALPHVDLANIDVLVIENVGNLVCPAEFKVGEDFKIMMLSVTEGDEKPLKYPLMFRESSLLLINKIDLLKYTNFNLDEAKANARKVNPDIEIMDISCITGEGISEWTAWLSRCYQKKFGTNSRA
ncbi:MAG TPA: hydrogenase accessory protein HypB [Chloroflexi bacterium]|nr:hydrogenase accessory protein HypB [Chloroflexota bacterium]